jgi:hypothetical protein
MGRHRAEARALELHGALAAGQETMIERISVVLPAPLRAIRPANSPAPTSMLTFRRIRTGPMLR